MAVKGTQCLYALPFPLLSSPKTKSISKGNDRVNPLSFMQKPTQLT